MTYLLDSSVYIQPLRAVPSQNALLRWQGAGFKETAISIMTESEVLSGLYLHGEQQRFLYYQNALRDRIQILQIDGVVSRLYARLKARALRTGALTSDLPLYLAATAKIYGLILATLNPEHFQGIEGLTLEDWSHP